MPTANKTRTQDSEYRARKRKLGRETSHQGRKSEEPIRNEEKREFTPRAKRAPTLRAKRALDVFARLRNFFAHDAQLAQALSWDEKTVFDWRDRKVVRPHTTKVLQLALMFELCLEGRAYLDEDHDVGEWVTTPLPNLHGKSPAGWVRERGKTGLAEITYGLVDWRPRLPAGEVEAIDEDEAKAAMEKAAEEDPGVREFIQMLGETEEHKRAFAERKLAAG